MDDNRMVRETMRRQLAICGYEVVMSADGQEAVQAYRDARSAGHPFDAVILDLMVDTGWGGERTLQALMQLDPCVNALLCSGSLAGSGAEYVKKGFRAVLTKPYSLGDLRLMVEAALPAQGRS
jgi:CheY-like chemotaxis protein